MITLQSEYTMPDTYPLERLGRITDLLFFDIETTGFSAEKSSLYLIGCTYYESGSWRLIQWFAETPEAELEVLCTFFEFLSRFTTVVHFNGDGFDIPYLQKRSAFLGLDCSFAGVFSVDIYKRIRPYRSLLGLESLKQKAIERFLGIHRRDMYSGGQLIEVYKDYLITGEQTLFHMLILHNEEDLKGMPFILPILNYPDFLEHDFTLRRQEILEQPALFGTASPSLCLELASGYTVPVPFSREAAFHSLKAEGSRLTVTVDLYEGTLKHFFSDYKNYYYLIYEDSAIHKSVAEYVDKSARVKATAKTCYTKAAGRFLPQPVPIWEPCLKADYKDKLTYVPYREELFEEPERLNAYVRHLLTAG